MGMSYDDLSIYGRLRKVQNCGPYSMFVKLVQQWGNRLSPTEVRPNSSSRTAWVADTDVAPAVTRQIAGKVKLFFFEYARNRHKMTTITPSYHAVRFSSADSVLEPRLTT